MNDFIKQAVKTESNNFNSIYQRTYSQEYIRLLHGSMGCVTEAGELLDAIKKYTFYDKPIDTINIKEELGDLFWYIAIICDEMGWTFEEIQELVIKKLQTRYPEKFTSDKAINRDLDKEREVLENEI